MSKKSRTGKQDGLLELERPRPTSLPPLPERPLVSVIVPSRNLRPYVEETILSVLNQDYDAIEVVLIDGASTDGTLEVLHKYDSDPRVRWISEPDSSPEDAFNKGLRLARGELVGLLPVTDTYAPGALQELVEHFASDPLLALVGGWTQYVDELGVPIHPSEPASIEIVDYTVDDIVGFNSFPRMQATLFRRDIALVIGGFDLTFKTSDTIFLLHYMLESAQRGAHLRSVTKVWANYRVHQNQVHASPDRGAFAHLLERIAASRRYAQKYKRFLTARQVRTLRRYGYYRVLRHQVQVRHQLLQAIPAALGYVRFGGGPHLLRHLVNRLRGRI